MPGVFTEWENNVVGVRVPGARDRWGGTTATTTEPATGTLVERTALVRDAAGAEVTSSALFLCSLAKRALFVPGREVVVEGRSKPLEILSVGVTDVGDTDLDGLEVNLA